MNVQNGRRALRPVTRRQIALRQHRSRSIDFTDDGDLGSEHRHDATMGRLDVASARPPPPLRLSSRRGRAVRRSTMNDIIELGGAAAARRPMADTIPPAGVCRRQGRALACGTPGRGAWLAGSYKCTSPDSFVPGRHPKQANPVAVCKLQGCALLVVALSDVDAGCVAGQTVLQTARTSIDGFILACCSKPLSALEIEA